MGRKTNWFRAVKKALSTESKEHKDQRSIKSKKKWFLKKKKGSSHPISKPSPATNNTSPTTPTPTTSTTTPIITTAATTTATSSLPPVVAPPQLVEVIKPLPVIPSENVKLKEEDEQTKHAQSIAIATAKAAEAAAAAAQAAAEVVRLTNAARFPGKPKEEVAALRIQTAFRGYLARRALRALRGLSSLKIVMQGQSMKSQITDTLKSMETLAHVQSQASARRLRISEDNNYKGRKGQTLDKQFKELEKFENGNGWDASPRSKEKIEAQLQSQHEAAIRRERAMAYSLNHQQTWRNSPKKSAQTVFMDLKNQHSGWSWLERWLAARPWETANSTPDNNPDLALIAKAIMNHVTEKQTSASSSPRSLNSSSPKAIQKRRISTSRLSTSTPSKTRKPKTKTKLTSPKASPRRSLCCPEEDDAKSMQSDLATSPAANALPSYMVPTESARAKARTDNNHETVDRLSVCSAKKRVSSPARSRPSVSSITDANSIVEQQIMINGM